MAVLLPEYLITRSHLSDIEKVTAVSIGAVLSEFKIVNDGRIIHIAQLNCDFTKQPVIAVFLSV